MRTARSAALVAAAVVWVFLLVLAPAALARGVMPAETLATYHAASLLCHQKAERSFLVGNMQMPVCARCFGLYLSGAAGALVACGSARRRAAPVARLVRIALAAAAIPMALSVGLELAGLVAGSNASRFASALPLGLAAGWVLQRTIAASVARADAMHKVSFRRT